MSTFPNSPRLLKGGLVLLDPQSGAIQRIIAFGYNPDTLTRSLQPQVIEQEPSASPVRLKAPPIETFRLEAELDAADQLEFPDQNSDAVQNGLQPQLAALEVIVYPPSSQLVANNALAGSGTLEIAPVEAPLVLFVWSRNRIVPVQITELSVTEEAFDPSLNPIRAKISLGMRALTVNDFGFSHKGGNLFLAYQRQKERLAALNRAGTLGTLGLTGIP